METLNIRIVDTVDGSKLVAVSVFEIQEIDGVTLFSHRRGLALYHVSEYETGLRAGVGATEDEAWKDAEEHIQKAGPKKMRAILKRVLRQYGAANFNPPGTGPLNCLCTLMPVTK
jgi:hypothetical protein